MLTANYFYSAAIIKSLWTHNSETNKNTLLLLSNHFSFRFCCRCFCFYYCVFLRSLLFLNHADTLSDAHTSAKKRRRRRNISEKKSNEHRENNVDFCISFHKDLQKWYAFGNRKTKTIYWNEMIEQRDSMLHTIQWKLIRIQRTSELDWRQ